ncbi:hypothetical protein CONCODRAFT_78597 [Conidiobolus coronatus NRRL 28638]|uniref:Uncharacterized protein n=1 Tax=Conidiobolus coronatus (strain ATCC 28846 / CBS 209.66 / NRRL 28638) TaxID=796925 RepID=A0A137P7N1_CONC2|nr:hypothetical protein CONCODRAFT_78597 [Conidiobolus coronatus NRRL 28638]|eukprot:KXN70979.1 hypothetical protein CONCODRAFT_78597 [Conidiobolus coronatus NRRL 28638]
MTHDIPHFSNIFIEIFISLNLFFASYYLLYKENVILNGSENLKTFFVACTSEYFLIWALVKLLGKCQESTLYYTNYAYFGLILAHMCLYQRYPKVFNRFIKFNIGFSYGYFITNSLLQQYNSIHILISSVIGINWNNSDTAFDQMTVYCTNFIYAATLFEAISIIVYLIPIKNPSIFGGIGGLLICLIFYIFGSRIKIQLEDLKNKSDFVDLKGDKLLMSTKDVENVN